MSLAPTSDLEAAKGKVLAFHTWVASRLEALVSIQESVQSLPASEQRAARCELSQCRTEIAKLRSIETATQQYLISLMRDFTPETRHPILSDFDDN